MENSIDKRSAFFTLLICILIMVGMWFMMVWQAPDPPIPVYGLEMNFGTARVGKGKRQPKPVVREPKPVVPEKAEQETPVETEQITESPEVVEEVAEEVQAPKEQAPEAHTTPVIEEETPVEVPKDKEEETVEKEEPKPVVEEKEKVVEESASSTEEAITENSENTEEGQGVEEDPKKDKGVKEAEKNKEKPILLDKKTQGNGNSTNAALDLTGWKWDDTPSPDDQTEESGKIVFEIDIDDQGYVVGVRTLEKSISSTLEQVYRNAVENLSFSPTNNNNNPKPRTKGRITFVIKSN